jgi:hypothetical protein
MTQYSEYNEMYSKKPRLAQGKNPARWHHATLSLDRLATDPKAEPQSSSMLQNERALT